MLIKVNSFLAHKIHKNTDHRSMKIPLSIDVNTWCGCGWDVGNTLWNTIHSTTATGVVGTVYLRLGHGEGAGGFEVSDVNKNI